MTSCGSAWISPAPNFAVNHMITPGCEQRDQRAGANHALAQGCREPGSTHRHLWIHSNCDLADPEVEPCNHKSQTHYRNACPDPSQEGALIGENLRFNLVRIESPFFVQGIGFFLVRLGHSQAISAFTSDRAQPAPVGNRLTVRDGLTTAIPNGGVRSCEQRI